MSLRIYFTTQQRYFSPFPHGTYTLSIIDTYLAEWVEPQKAPSKTERRQSQQPEGQTTKSTETQARSTNDGQGLNSKVNPIQDFYLLWIILE